jgi:hypothetical protein
MTSPYDPGDGRQPLHPQPRTPSTSVLSIIGFVCAVVALLFVPVPFGIAGIVLGIVGHTRGETLGMWAAITSVIAMIVGIVLGILVVSSGR